MKHYRFIIAALLALGCTTAQARQDSEQVLAHGKTVCMMSDIDKGRGIAAWTSTENGWIKDTAWVSGITVKNVPETVLSHIEKNFPDPMMPLCWQLTNETDRTVMHCYFRMPADTVANIWLTSEETAIVDLETGVQYRAKGATGGCWRKHFYVVAEAGTVQDLQVYFPKLPESVRKIAVYGIPAWGMRGQNMTLNRTTERLEYDKTPAFHTPRLVKPENNYDKDNADSWPVYTDTHLIKPVPDNTMALWLTPKATYVAIAKEQNWMREYYGIHELTALFDENSPNTRCELRSIQGLPAGHTFWIEGYSGDCQAFLLEFDPLPPDVTTICFFEPDSEPFNAWGANWEGLVFNHLDVATLRANQSLFEYNERVIVK